MAGTDLRATIQFSSTVNGGKTVYSTPLDDLALAVRGVPIHRAGIAVLLVLVKMAFLFLTTILSRLVIATPLALRAKRDGLKI